MSTISSKFKHSEPFFALRNRKSGLQLAYYVDLVVSNSKEPGKKRNNARVKIGKYMVTKLQVRWKKAMSAINFEFTII